MQEIKTKKIENKKESLDDVWNERWEGENEEAKISFLGKRMFQSKRKVLQKALDSLEITSAVEIGCGLGYTMRVFKEMGIQCKGIDASIHAVKACKKKGLTVEHKNLSEVNETFDLVSSDGMLEHFLNFEPYARDMMRISKKYVMLIQPNHDSFAGKTLAYLSELLRDDVNVFEYNYRIRDFIHVFEKNGFMNIKSEPIFLDVFRLLLFQKQGA